MVKLARIVILLVAISATTSAQDRRTEFLLERAPAAKVMEYLQKEYPTLSFQPHETLNGFYATGSEGDLDKVRGEMPNLDRVPEPPPPTLAHECRALKYAEFDSTMAILRRAFPEAVIISDSRLHIFIVEGLEGDDLDRFDRALQLLDKPRAPRE